MSDPKQATQVLQQALALSPSERAELVESVLRSFDFPLREGVEAAWAEESEARLAAYRRGEMKSIPAEDVFAEIDSLVMDR